MIVKGTTLIIGRHARRPVPRAPLELDRSEVT